MNKAEWMTKVSHIHAQDAAWFVGFLFFILVVVLWRDAWKEIKEERKRNGLSK